MGDVLDVRCAQTMCRIELALGEELVFAPLESLLLERPGMHTYVRVSPPERKASVFMAAEGHELPLSDGDPS